jgi:hypothetical protein
MRDRPGSGKLTLRADRRCGVDVLAIEIGSWVLHIVHRSQ